MCELKSCRVVAATGFFAALRHSMVAVGFNPRKTAIKSGVAWRRHEPYFERRYASRIPTATIEPSLCDEEPGPRPQPLRPSLPVNSDSYATVSKWLGFTVVHWANGRFLAVPSSTKVSGRTGRTPSVDKLKRVRGYTLLAAFGTSGRYSPDPMPRIQPYAAAIQPTPVC
jgi:hypothetical protein